MGVPVATFVGKTLFGRATWSQLNNLQLTELAGKNEQEFVDISIAAAGMFRGWRRCGARCASG